MKKKDVAMLLVALAALPSVATASITLESAPPVVISTHPVAGTFDVSPALTEIRVTYSKPMQDGSWSWSTWGQENFPETTGGPHYLPDGRTCVLPVVLEPGKFYAIWLNNDRFKNFQDTGGRPAVPYLLTFVTASERVEDDSIRSETTSGASDLTDRVVVEDLALRMLAAIRDQEDDVLKELSVDRIDGWRDALPHFAFELRERFQQMTGGPFAMQVDQSLTDDDLAVVKCVGPEELRGIYLVLFFVRTPDGWRNWNLRNSPAETALDQHLRRVRLPDMPAPRTTNN